MKKLPPPSDWQFSTGLLYSNERVYRGELIWPAPSIFPMIGVSYKQLSLKGHGFNVTNSWKKLTFNYGS